MIKEGLIFLGGVGSAIAVDVLKDLIEQQLIAYLKKKFPSQPSVEVKSIEQLDGSYLLVVTERE
jgi:hypothetical protein